LERTNTNNKILTLLSVNQYDPPSTFSTNGGGQIFSDYTSVGEYELKMMLFSMMELEVM
jgi:hypothetical protein